MIFILTAQKVTIAPKQMEEKTNPQRIITWVSRSPTFKAIQVLRETVWLISERQQSVFKYMLISCNGFSILNAVLFITFFSGLTLT
jgi:hypothetical protein